jgi:hypothetical protein
MRTEVKYNQIVGITKDHTIFVLNDTFSYQDEDGSQGLHGATRYEMDTISQDTVDYNNDVETVRDIYKELWVEAVKGGGEERSLDEFAKDLIEKTKDNGDDYLFPHDDPSFRDEMEDALADASDATRKAIEDAFGIKGKDFVAYDCVCCGRCGKITPDYFEKVLNPDLLQTIMEVEND